MSNFPDEIESIQSRIGVADLPMDPMPVDIADVFVILKPQSEWTKADSKQELIEKVKEKVAVLPGINFEFTQPIEMRFNELLTGIREDVAIKIYGENLNVLADKAEEITGLISGIEGVAGVKAEATRGLPQITVKYDRNKLAKYGLQINELNTIIETAFSGSIAGNIYEGERMFDLVVRLDEKHRKNIDDIRDLYVNLPDGNQIPLKTVADVSYQPGPMQISRDNTNRRTYVGINVEGRDIKSLVTEIQQTLDEKLELPDGYYIRYGGAFENLERATSRLTMVVPLALALIFMLVFFAVKSFKQTLMIYVAVPFAAVGGIFSLYLRGMPFSISAGVGFIVLFGVAVLNGLVLISGFNEMKAEGKFSISEIIKKGSVRRLRPILLTASTDILGFLPMAVSTSAGAEVQRPLATVVIGGMLTSTLLTLIVLPILYKWVETGKKIRLPKIKPAALMIILFLSGIGFSGTLNAQKNLVSLDRAIERAKEKYPSLKAAQLETEKQKSLKKTAYDFGITSVYTGKEEIAGGFAGVYNQIGISQSDIDIFGIISKSNLVKAKTNFAEKSEKLTELSLARQVSSTFFDVLYFKKEFELLKHLDTLYSGFMKAAELKYKTGQSSKIEYLSASAKFKELQINIQTAENNYKTALQNLNKFLMYDDSFDIAEEIPENVLFNTDLSENNLNLKPVFDYYSSSVKIAEYMWKKEKSGYLPKLNLGYLRQSVDGVSGFSGWEAGISMPLIFLSKSGYVKASKINYKIAEQNFKQKSLELNTKYSALMNRYKVLKNIIEYYENEAVPLAEEQISASGIAYRSGSIDYIQFIQSVETAVNTKQKFLLRQTEYFKLSTLLKYPGN